MKKSVRVLLLILVSLEVLGSDGCREQEREALLGLKARLGSPLYLQWPDGNDCCQWQRVECNTTTWRVEGLYLYDLWNESGNWYLNHSDFLPLEDLKSLDLSDNKIAGCVENEGSKSLSKLEDLTLDENKLEGTMLRKSLRPFSSIRTLSLMRNEFNGTVVAEDFSDLGHLENLIFDSSSNLVNEFFKTIGALTSLKVLSMRWCGIKGTLPAADWSALTKLEVLDLRNNEFERPLPSSFGNITSLQNLYLDYNNFNESFSSNLASLTSLEYLSFEENQFEVPISFAPFANLSNLKIIYGSGNKVINDSHPTLQTWVPKFQLQVLNLSSTSETNSIPLPNFLLYQYNLRSVDFSGCKLEGEFPNWLLENNTEMSDLVLRNCHFKGTFQLPSRPHLSLSKIDVSVNALNGQILTNNISSMFPNLKFLNMSLNTIQGSLTHHFGRMNSLEILDLSHNQLSGELPKNICWSRIRFLKLSNNTLDGPLFPTLSTMNLLEHLYLDGNNLSGSISSSFFDTSLFSLDISNNYLVGKLPSRVGDLLYLEALSLSNNHLEGPIPTKFGELENLVFLDLSRNNFTGFVPSFVNSSVRFVHLSYNRLSGLSKGMVGEFSSIEVLDLRYNEISTSSVHDMIQDPSPSNLSILLLGGNHLTGQIPNQFCQLKNLTILDLSHNNFSGPIPSCLGKIPFNTSGKGRTRLAEDDCLLQAEKEAVDDFDKRGGRRLLQMIAPRRCKTVPVFSVVQEKVEFTTKKRSYSYTWSVLIYMTGIDLSCNKLNGKIPLELGNLKNVLSLNFSHNYLTGQIPTTFANLTQIESLDLSFNKLSGQIPQQLSGLTFISVFSVAQNNLAGATPDRKGQFMTFDESSYEGNPFLCGPPLPRSCNPYGQPPTTSTNGLDTDGDNDSLVDMYVFCVTFAVSYASVLLVIAAILYINPYWRRAWFYYIELISSHCCYFIKDNLC